MTSAVSCTQLEINIADIQDLSIPGEISFSRNSKHMQELEVLQKEQGR